jgi:hypothetical protein
LDVGVSLVDLVEDRSVLVAEACCHSLFGIVYG